MKERVRRGGNGFVGGEERVWERDGEDGDAHA